MVISIDAKRGANCTLHRGRIHTWEIQVIANYHAGALSYGKLGVSANWRVAKLANYRVSIFANL